MELKQGLAMCSGILLALLVMLAAMGAAGADDAPLSTTAGKERTITVTGTGSVYVAPDIARFSAGVVTESNASADAIQKNALLMDRVTNAIRQAGIPEKDIKTGKVTLEPIYTQPRSSSEEPKISGYRATNTVTVTVRDLSKVGAAIDAATGAGANKVAGVSFELSEETSSAAYKDALKKAVSDGADKAKAIADAAGVGALALRSISESGVYYPQPYYVELEGGRAAPAAAPTPILPGEQKVQATVSMVYTFE